MSVVRVAASLAPSLQKHVDPASPTPLRMMAARLLLPASPTDALSLLYALSADPDEGVRAQALESARNLPEKIALASLRDPHVDKDVLAWIAGLVVENDRFLELLALNPATPDEALAKVAGRCSGKVAEILAQNQLRLLRSEDYLLALLENPALPVSVRDRTADFAVRSGIRREDVPALLEAQRRVYGDVREPEKETAAKLLADAPEELAIDRGEEEELEEEKKLTLAQRILAMSVSEKIKLATLGNKEARNLLLRDTNKLVCLAAIQSPRISESEVVTISQSRTVHEDVIREIAGNREWMKLYQVKLNLVRNPKTPPGLALRLVNHLREKDLKDLRTNKNIPHVVQTAARNLLMKKSR